MEEIHLNPVLMLKAIIIVSPNHFFGSNICERISKLSDKQLKNKKPILVSRIIPELTREVPGLKLGEDYEMVSEENFLSKEQDKIYYIAPKKLGTNGSAFLAGYPVRSYQYVRMSKMIAMYCTTELEHAKLISSQYQKDAASFSTLIFDLPWLEGAKGKIAVIDGERKDISRKIPDDLPKFIFGKVKKAVRSEK
jgi:hypothetical protein